MPLECDTDGLYSWGEDISEMINERLQGRFADYPLRHYLKVETNKYDGMLLVKMKNYILKHGDTLTFKGSGFHGRQLPNIVDMAFERFARALFSDVDDLDPIWAEFSPKSLQSPSKYSLSDFAMTVELSKPPESYAQPKSPKHKGNMYWQLCNHLKGEVEAGDEIQYVKVRSGGGYLPLGVFDDEITYKMLDFEYYAKRLKEKIKWMMDVVGDAKYHKLGEFA